MYRFRKYTKTVSDFAEEEKYLKKELATIVRFRYIFVVNTDFEKTQMKMSLGEIIFETFPLTYVFILKLRNKINTRYIQNSTRNTK